MNMFKCFIIVFVTSTVILSNLVPRCFMSLCFVVDDFDKRAVFQEDFLFLKSAKGYPKLWMQQFLQT